jgi:hypothetical protein
MRLVFILLFLSLSINAETIDPEKAAIIRQLVQGTSAEGLKKQLLSLMKIMESGIVRQNPGYPAAYADEFAKKFASHLKESDLEQLSMPVYAKTFTVEELKQLLAFRQSPVGQKLAAAQPEILNETAQASMRYAQQLVPEINRELAAEHPDWKKQLDETMTPPQLISKTDPQIPPGGFKADGPKEGTVAVAIVIDENGIPQDAQVVKSLGSGFDESAIQTVRTWRFKPAMRGNTPVKTKANVEVHFKVTPKQ